MELINDIQIEVSEVVVKNFSILGNRNVFFFKRLLFMGDIKEISEDAYLDSENKIKKCRRLIFDNGTYIKVSDKYEDLKELHSDWWNRKVKDVNEGSDPK